MYRKITSSQRIRKAEREAENARAKQGKLEADLDYMAMMCDVELEAEQEENQEGQNDEVWEGKKIL